MKKILSVVALSAVIFTGNTIIAADNAEAYFDHGSLWRVVYDDALNYEVVTDLGNVNDLLAAGSSTVGGGADAWTLNMFPQGTTYADLNVAYCACDNTYLGYDEDFNFLYQDDAWVSGAAGGQNSGYNGYGTFVGAVAGMAGKYSVNGAATVQGSPTEVNSYYFNMDNNGLMIGGFASFTPEQNGSEAELGDLAGEGYVEQYLYFWDEDLNNVHPGELVASIRTMADGSTTITTSAVPVPATVVLFGSGLLGLMGVRRRSDK